MTPFAEPLSTLDSMFLVAERDDVPMHIGAALVLEAKPLMRDGRLDVGAIRDHVASRLHRIPRYRQRLEPAPLEGRMLWVDDDRFDLDAHIRHIRLGERCGDRHLKEAVGEILSRPLDRRHPLWELWILEGLERDRFALVTKVHHCMADGLGGVEQLCALLEFGPDAPPDTAPAWTPRPVPGVLELAGETVAGGVRRASHAIAMAGQALRAPWDTWTDVTESAISLAHSATALLHPAAFTPLNGTIGPERRFEWLTMRVDELKLVKQHFAVTINDVVLATVAGALHRYLRKRGARLPRADVRAAVPVSMREAGAAAGNQVSVWLVPLPVTEPDPLKRLEAIRVTTARCKSERGARALYSLLGLAEGVPLAALRPAVRALETLLPFNVIVTNVPGPQFPLFLAGSRLEAAYPSVPLFETQGLGIALFSYAGTLHCGFLAEPHVVPDLDEFILSLAVSYGELLELASGTYDPRGRATAA